MRKQRPTPWIAPSQFFDILRTERCDNQRKLRNLHRPRLALRFAEGRIDRKPQHTGQIPRESRGSKRLNESSTSKARILELTTVWKSCRPIHGFDVCNASCGQSILVGKGQCWSPQIRGASLPRCGNFARNTRGSASHPSCPDIENACCVTETQQL